MLRSNINSMSHRFERLMEGATKVKCSEFGDAIIKHMGSGSAGAGQTEPKPVPQMARA